MSTPWIVRGQVPVRRHMAIQATDQLGNLDGSTMPWKDLASPAPAVAMGAMVAQVPLGGEYVAPITCNKPGSRPSYLVILRVVGLGEEQHG